MRSASSRDTKTSSSVCWTNFSRCNFPFRVIVEWYCWDMHTCCKTLPGSFHRIASVTWGDGFIYHILLAVDCMNVMVIILALCSSQTSCSLGSIKNWFIPSITTPFSLTQHSTATSSNHCNHSSHACPRMVHCICHFIAVSWTCLHMPSWCYSHGFFANTSKSASGK